MTLMAGDPERDDVAERPARPVQRSLSGDQAVALQLLRANNMASTRLQLALARSDRRVAMAALDNLAAIDAEFEELVGRVSDADGAPELAAITAWTAEEKAALASEKLNLACDVRGPGLVSAPDRLADVSDAHQHAGDDPPTTGAVPEPSAESAGEMDPPPVHRWWPFVLMALLVFIVAAALIVAGVLPGSEKLTGVAEFRRLTGLF